MKPGKPNNRREPQTKTAVKTDRGDFKIKG
jgi:hypothetical protein